jgi:YesN/AraC family two-component response regulator
MLSAFDGDEYSHAAYSAGCSEFLTKPIDVEKLHRLVEKLLSEVSNDQEDTPNGVQFR